MHKNIFVYKYFILEYTFYIQKNILFVFSSKCKSIALYNMHIYIYIYIVLLILDNILQ